MERSANYQLSKDIDLDLSQLRRLEKMAIEGDAEGLSCEIMFQSNVLQNKLGYAGCVFDTYVATEDCYKERKLYSTNRGDTMLYIQELLNLCDAEDVEIPTNIRRKAKYALLRGYLGRVEELEDIVNNDRKDSHIFSDDLRELASTSFLLDIAKCEVSRRLQDLGIIDTDCNMN